METVGFEGNILGQPMTTSYWLSSLLPEGVARMEQNAKGRASGHFTSVSEQILAILQFRVELQLSTQQADSVW